MNNGKSTISILILLIISGIVLIYTIMVFHSPRESGTIKPELDQEGHYTRIISLAPNITETLFALGLGDRVVGVTRFCKYPEEALKIEKVGGLIDPNYEAIILLKPDLVFLLPEHENAQKYLDELGLKTVVVHNRVIEEILGTITTIGEICSVKDKARELVSELESKMNTIRNKTLNAGRPRVMISVGRSFGGGKLNEVTISGKNTFYDELITYAGGINVYEKHDISFPVVSKEGILYLNPEIIIEMIPSTEVSEDMIIKEWESVADVEAVKNKRVYAFKQDYAIIPGPRFILFLEDLARTLHPERNWDSII
ncbi:ABC transporter substrate-binding protein [Candidatus Latescibacterota bacterium]